MLNRIDVAGIVKVFSSCPASIWSSCDSALPIKVRTICSRFMVGLLPLSTSSAGTSPKTCDSIFNKCDLPEPKKPEIHAPFCSWFDGSLYASRNLARFRQISSVSTYSLTSSLRFFSSLALITPLMLRSMSLLNNSLKLIALSPFICVPFFFERILRKRYSHST